MGIAIGSIWGALIIFGIVAVIIGLWKKNAAIRKGMEGTEKVKNTNIAKASNTDIVRTHQSNNNENVAPPPMQQNDPNMYINPVQPPPIIIMGKNIRIIIA